MLQKRDLSCGAATLATVLRFQHGEDVSEREVAIEMMGRNDYIRDPDLVRIRQGFSLLDMKRVAETRGYEGGGLGKLSFADALELTPPIVPVSLKGYDHFVVFIGALNDRVLLADSSFGRRTMKRGEFLAAWVEHEKLGRIGFRVRRTDGLIAPNRLVATHADFNTLN